MAVSHQIKLTWLRVVPKDMDRGRNEGWGERGGGGAGRVRRRRARDEVEGE